MDRVFTIYDTFVNLKTMRVRVFLALAALLLILAPSWVGPDTPRPTLPPVSVCFTPGQTCDDMLIHQINAARSTIRMAAFTLTSEPIADALIAARQRGVMVEVVLDRSQWKARRSQGHRLREHDVGVRYDCEHQSMHNKYVVIDLNFAEAAQRR